MHRDLRSPNIIVSTKLESGKVNAKVGDFGLAQYTLPHLSEILACWQWLAPEVFDAKSTSYDEKSDVYSFGMVLWELASRQLPYAEFQEYISKVSKPLTREQVSDNVLLETLRGDGFDIVGLNAVKELFKVHEIKAAILERDLRPTLPSNCLPEIVEIIQQCWSKDPMERPALDDLLETFETLCVNTKNIDISKISTSSSSSALSSPDRDRSNSRKPTEFNVEQRSAFVFQTAPKSRFSSSHLLGAEAHGVCSIQSITIDDLSLTLRSSAKIYFRIRLRGEVYRTPVVQYGKVAGKPIKFENLPWEIKCTQSSWLSIQLVVKSGLMSRAEACILVSVLTLPEHKTTRNYSIAKPEN